MKTLLLASAFALALSVPATAAMHGGGGHMGGGFHGGGFGGFHGGSVHDGFRGHDFRGRRGFFGGGGRYDGCPWWAQVQGLCYPD
jgi:hypothetical protein